MPAAKLPVSLLAFLGLLAAPLLAGCGVEAAEIPAPAPSEAREVADPRATVATEITRGERPSEASRLYVGGGESADGAAHADVWSAAILADGALGPWEAEASLPKARSGHALVRAGGELLVVGGREADAPASDVLASIAGARAIDTWRAVTKSAVAIGAGVTTDGSSLLVLGGVGTSGIRRDGFVATLSAGIPGAFAETMPLPDARARFGATHVGPFVFAIGGEGDLGATSEVFVGRASASGAVARWDAATSLPGAVSDHAVAASGDNLFVIGGAGTADVHVARVSDAGGLAPWRAAERLPTSRGGHCVVTSGATMFAIGGADAGGVVAEVLVTTVRLDGSLAPWRVATKLPDGRARLGCAIR